MTKIEITIEDTIKDEVSIKVRAYPPISTDAHTGSPAEHVAAKLLESIKADDFFKKKGKVNDEHDYK